MALLLIPILVVLLVAAAPTITTAVGTGQPGDSGDGGPAVRAELNKPFDVAFDADGNLFLSDTFNHRVRRVDARSGVITTVAGNGTKGFSGDGGPATKAELNEPYGVVARPGRQPLLRRPAQPPGAPGGRRDGVITTVAGDGSKASSGDGGPADRAGLVEPNGVALDATGGRLFIADVADNRVRVVDLRKRADRDLRRDGQGPARRRRRPRLRRLDLRRPGRGGRPRRHRLHPRTPGEHAPRRRSQDRDHHDPRRHRRQGILGRRRPRPQATFNGPKELAVDRAGNLFIVDTENHAIRRIDAGTGRISTVAGNGQRGGGGDAYIGPGVVIGDRCKIQNHALVYEPAFVEQGVFIGPAVVFTNDTSPVPSHRKVSSRAPTTGSRSGSTSARAPPSVPAPSASPQ